MGDIPCSRPHEPGYRVGWVSRASDGERAAELPWNGGLDAEGLRWAALRVGSRASGCAEMWDWDACKVGCSCARIDDPDEAYEGEAPKLRRGAGMRACRRGIRLALLVAGRVLLTLGPVFTTWLWLFAPDSSRQAGGPCL